MTGQLTRWSLSQRSHDDTQLGHSDGAIFIFVKEHKSLFEFWKENEFQFF